MVIKLYRAARLACRDPKGLKRIREHTTGADEQYGTSEAMRVLPEMKEVDKQYKEWAGLEHIKTVEHDTYEDGGMKWTRFTSYYRFKNTPWYKRLWINFKMWGRS